MIVIPAILVAIAEAAFIGGLAGAVICGMEDKRTLPTDAPKELRTAHTCAAQGAATGVVFGLVWPVIGVADDLARPTIGAIDDMAISSANSVDDLATAPRRGMRFSARRLTRDFMAPIKREANISRAQYYKSLRLPKNAKPLQGYGYVVEVKNVAKNRLYKIGRTTRPPERLGEIQTKLNKTVGGTADYVCIISSKNMFQLESKMHATFESQRIRKFAAGTEFFHLNPAQLAVACSF